MKLPKILTFVLLSFSLATHAQMDSCNVFLQGNYVEVGINFNGVFGSSVAVPSVGYCGHSYHPKGPAAMVNGATCSSICYSGGQNLGFVADPDKDGWTVGSPYPYYGDYFMPGTPQEGWSIMADGVSIVNFGWDACVGADLYGTGNGANISYATTGKTITAIWEGTWDSIKITQTTQLDTDKTFFTVHVRLINTGSSPRYNVYYMRTVDPDNAEPQTSAFNTMNKIERQLPDTSVLVSAWGVDASNAVLSAAYLGMITKDSFAKSFYMLHGLMPDSAAAPLDSLWAGDTIHTVWFPLQKLIFDKGDSLLNDIGIGLIFKVDTLFPPKDTVTISYAYAFRRDAVDSAAATTGRITRPYKPADTTHHTGIGSIGNENGINIYPNPARQNLTISGLSAGDYISVYDLMGRKADDWLVISNGASTFNTGKLLPGMYIIRVSDKNGIIKARLPLQKL
jgi:hypothetical protein